MDASQLLTKTGSDTSYVLEYSLIGVGVFLCLVGVMRLIQIAMRDKADREENGGSVVSVFILILCVVIGLVLVGFGWKGASANIAPA